MFNVSVVCGLMSFMSYWGLDRVRVNHKSWSVERFDLRSILRRAQVFDWSDHLAELGVICVDELTIAFAAFKPGCSIKI